MASEGLVFCSEASFDRATVNSGERPVLSTTTLRWVLLKAVNDRWMDHLQIVDYIREGIGLRGYGQVDPLIAYKRETFDLFQTTLRQIKNQAVSDIFKMNIRREMASPVAEPAMISLSDSDMEAIDQSSSGRVAASATAVMPSRDLGSIDWSKVARNDPCPCGSGKKFKQCHYPELRQQGVI